MYVCVCVCVYIFTSIQCISASVTRIIYQEGLATLLYPSSLACMGTATKFITIYVKIFEREVCFSVTIYLENIMCGDFSALVFAVPCSKAT